MTKTSKITEVELTAQSLSLKRLDAYLVFIQKDEI